jgi:hypothetical protein
MVEGCIAEDLRLDVVYNCMTTLYNSMDHENRSLILKKILMHFLRKFPTDFENIRDSDDYIRKTLHLWQIFVSSFRMQVIKPFFRVVAAKQWEPSESWKRLKRTILIVGNITSFTPNL